MSFIHKKPFPPEDWNSKESRLRRFGTSKLHLSPPVAKAAVPSKAVVLFVDLLFIVAPIVCWRSVFGLCFVIKYFVCV